MIRDVYPGSQIRIFSHPGHRIRILDPGVKKALDPGGGGLYRISDLDSIPDPYPQYWMDKKFRCF